MISFYDKDGNPTEEKNALYSHTTTKNTERFYVKSYQNRLYDPFTMIERDKQLKWNLKQVSKEIYDNYVQFLKTTSVKYKHYAERLI